MRFRLQPFIEGAVTKMVYKTGQNGDTVMSRVTFLPGEEYTATDGKLIQLIKGEIGDIRIKSVLTPQLKQTLAEYGVKYDVTKCGSCSGSKPNAIYNPFEILEED